MKDRHHRCQPSRNRAGNPAFWHTSRIPAFLPERPAFLALFGNNKKVMKSSIILAVPFCSKKLCDNGSDSVT